MKTIQLTGVIVPDDDKWIYDWFEMAATCPRDIRQGLDEAAGDDVTIEINSPGGEIASGAAIYHYISSYQGKTQADIIGHACSAATYASCGADTVRMTPAGLYMIHNVSTVARGNHTDLEKEAQVLHTADKAISNVYCLKTGLEKEDVLKMMEDTTWMDAEKAKELGFIDEIIGMAEDEKTVVNPIVMQNAFCNLLSEEVKNKIRNTVKCPEAEKSQDILLQTKLNLLKLGGSRE